MKSRDQLKEIDIKNRTRYYFDDIITDRDIYSVDILLDEKNLLDVSEGIVNKTSVLKECDICHYWYFLNYSLKFQPNVCNKCHELLMMSMNLSDNAILNIKGSDYHCVISLISKNEAIKLMQNAGLTGKSGIL